jgi:hypothetical protein
MELPLHVEEIDQHLVDELVRVVAHLLEESPERVLDGARGDAVPVRLHRRQVEHARADVHLGDLDPLRTDAVHEQRA